MEYIVEKILKRKIVDGIVYFLIKWQGYKTASWEPEIHLNCPELKAAFIENCAAEDFAEEMVGFKNL
jgi:chromobox protein 3